MKNRSTLTLIELLIMLLVFALAAALCLQAFAAADRTSAESARLDAAVTDAQNAAELLKSCGGDYEQAATILGGTWDGLLWVIPGEQYTLQIAPVDSGHPLLGCAELRVCTAEEEIFSLHAAWQEGGGSLEE